MEHKNPKSNRLAEDAIRMMRMVEEILPPSSENFQKQMHEQFTDVVKRIEEACCGCVQRFDPSRMKEAIQLITLLDIAANLLERTKNWPKASKDEV